MMAEMLFVPLNGVQTVPSPSELFYFILLLLALPMSVAMSGVLILKWTEINTKLPGSAWWLYPVFYAGFPLLYNLYTFRYLTPDISIFIFFFATLSPPVFGFLQAAFSDPEKNEIYLLGLVVNLFLMWYFFLQFLGYTLYSGESEWVLFWVLFSSFAIYCVSLYRVSIKARATRQSYDPVPAFFLTIIFSPTLVVGLLLIWLYIA